MVIKKIHDNYIKLLYYNEICTIPRQTHTTTRTKPPTYSPIIKRIDRWLTRQHNTHDGSDCLL